MRIALCQINTTVGDIAGNREKIAAAIASASSAGAELALLPELTLTGYPPEDLLLREHFLSESQAALQSLAREVTGIVAIVGFPERADAVYNSAAVLASGSIHAIYRKVHLPNYGVFDERRYFRSGPAGAVIDIGAHRIGLTICEDIWEPGPPASEEALSGAHLIVNISASPYHAGKGAERERMLAQRARDHLACVAFCGLVGGQDELIFDGHSCVIDHTGRTIARAAQFEEQILTCEIDLDAPAPARLRGGAQRPPARAATTKVAVLPPLPSPPLPSTPPTQPAPGDTVRPTIDTEEQEVYSALLLGLRDYVEKNGFRQVVLGLSGGIDSALVACLAADALGPARVAVAIMPSPYTSSHTRSDAHALAHALSIQAHELPIEEVMDSYRRLLSAALPSVQGGITEENLQARIRGNLLMALSNSLGSLVLATGNKSEMSVGYTTLYGDLAGGFAVIKDVPKTLVYRLARWRNSPTCALALASGELARSPIPQSIIDRAPSAELRPDQRDEDSLPPYQVLDQILRGYVELDLGRDQLVSQGLPATEVDRTIALVDRAEYKRRQAPPGIKITARAFGRDRRMPITNRYRP